MKRRGNRRYYQHHEVLLIRRIRDLLYEQGFTISGARNRLADSAGVWRESLLDVDGGLDGGAQAFDEADVATTSGAFRTDVAAQPAPNAPSPGELRGELMAIRNLLSP
jgi:hypothetical protein